MNKIILTVDRLEGDVAVCETADGEHVRILASRMPVGVRDGVRVGFRGGVWELLEDETRAAQHELFALAESLFDE